MAFSYVIDSADRLATGTFSGSVAGRDIAAAFRTVYEDPAWQTGFDTLWECSGITELLLERTDLASFVALHREFAARAGTGLEILVVTRSLDQVMAKIYGVMMRNQARRVRVCRSMAEAIEVLDQREQP
jgi:hypothetical protein